MSGEEVRGLRRPPPSEEGEATRLIQEAGESEPEGKRFSFNFSVWNAVMHRLALLLANQVLYNILCGCPRARQSPLRAACWGNSVLEGIVL